MSMLYSYSLKEDKLLSALKWKIFRKNYEFQTLVSLYLTRIFQYYVIIFHTWKQLYSEFSHFEKII